MRRTVASESRIVLERCRMALGARVWHTVDRLLPGKLRAAPPEELRLARLTVALVIILLAFGPLIFAVAIGVGKPLLGFDVALAELISTSAILTLRRTGRT